MIEVDTSEWSGGTEHNREESVGDLNLIGSSEGFCPDGSGGRAADGVVQVKAHVVCAVRDGDTSRVSELTLVVDGRCWTSRFYSSQKNSKHDTEYRCQETKTEKAGSHHRFFSSVLTGIITNGISSPT